MNNIYLSAPQSIIDLLVLTVSIADLTQEELNRVTNSLHERFRSFDNGNVREIGFGQKETNGVVRSDDFAVCFFVKKKRTPRKQVLRIAPTISVRLKRGRKFVRVELQTDVIEMDELTPTGVAIRRNSSTDAFATTGLPVRIRRQRNNEPFDLYGVVSVAHPFQSVNGELRVELSSRIPGNSNIAGRLLRRSSLPGSNFDACLIGANPLSMTNAGYFQATGLRLMMTDSQLHRAADNQVQAVALRQDGTTQIRIRHYISRTLRPLPYFGHMIGVIRGETLDGQMEVGTSGSIWRIGDRIAGLQFASVEPDYCVVYAQAAFAVVTQWLRTSADTSVRVLNAF